LATAESGASTMSQRYGESLIRRIAGMTAYHLLMADAGKNAGIGDLVAVQMQDRQNRPVGDRVQELVGMPAPRQRPSLRFAVADHTRNNQIRIVESGSVGMRERVAKFTALVNRAGRLRRHMARDAARKRELGEQAFHAFFIGTSQALRSR